MTNQTFAVLSPLSSFCHSFIFPEENFLGAVEG
jgi:hypothetical protein